MLTLTPKRSLPVALLLLLGAVSASAHLSYSGRNFGTFSGIEPLPVTISGQSAPTNWGWADGADEDFGHTHRLRFYRFTLQNTATVTISVTSMDATTMLPGFSIYSGLAHTSPLDYDTTLTFQYLATLPGKTKEGAFNALATWKMGNDASQSYSDFSTFSYMGNAADGTPANYGLAAGINGDGLADGFVSGTFVLPAGNYTLAVGGANYAGQGTGAPTTEGANEGADGSAVLMDVRVAAVPEPAAIALLASGMLALGGVRRRRTMPSSLCSSR